MTQTPFTPDEEVLIEGFGKFIVMYAEADPGAELTDEFVDEVDALTESIETRAKEAGLVDLPPKRTAELLIEAYERSDHQDNEGVQQFVASFVIPLTLEAAFLEFADAQVVNEANADQPRF